MLESFLYYLWQYQYFSHVDLTTTDGEVIQVIRPGFRNHDTGPDFTNARLLINDVEWVGTVEMHLQASDWLAHGHQHDRAYENVILHVVWQDDTSMTGRRVSRPNGTSLPTLELHDRTDPSLLERYRLLTTSADAIPCAGQFRSVSPLRITSMLDKAMLQRLERKAGAVRDLLADTDGDWEETAYRLLAIAMGFKVNAEPMAQLSRSVPLKALLKHRDNPGQVEALLFGTAGLLEGQEKVEDTYVGMLVREYQFLASKYGLTDRQMPGYIWKWGKLRPANFPSLRIAQLACLITRNASLFSLFVGTTDAIWLMKALQVIPSAYWQSHYRFGKAAETKVPTVGEMSAVSLVINVVAPLLAAYAHHRKEPAYIDRAISLLEQLPPEKNHLTEGWDTLGLGIRTAFDSQAAIELYNEFCIVKKCLSCQIGAALLK